MTDAEKWASLMDYMKHWPYSPYADLELQALARTVREIASGKEITDASFTKKKR